jgi:serine/threonine-protein kinase
MVLGEYMNDTQSLDIGVLSMEGDHKWSPLLKEKYGECQPRISPDGRWIAYVSNESGEGEIYVRPFPEVNKGRQQVSTGGGGNPLWSPDDRELFYRSGDAVMAVGVKTKPVLGMETPKVLFRGAYVTAGGVVSTWDISPDGKRFLMIKDPNPAATVAGRPRKISVVVNWFEELKRRVPTK